MPGFPNLFLILGPYGFNGSSYFHLIESQMRHIVRCLKRARGTSTTRIVISPEGNQRYLESMLRRRRNQVFFRGNCRDANSYYFDKNGDVALRPSTTFEAYWRSRRFDLDDYRFTG
jgi:cyclohexanone monooxygenase